MRMLDLFAGRLGWSKAFLARGWNVTAIDLVEPPEIPHFVEFMRSDVLEFDAYFVQELDFVSTSTQTRSIQSWASSFSTTRGKSAKHQECRM